MSLETPTSRSEFKAIFRARIQDCTIISKWVHACIGQHLKHATWRFWVQVFLKSMKHEIRDNDKYWEIWI